MENKARKFKRVMVVDDTYVDRFIAERNIRKFNFADDVIIKESALSALVFLKSVAQSPELIPDLIFLDIRMPEIDGFGFLAEYNWLPDCIKNHVEIVMLSTSLNPYDLERARKNPYVTQFVNKPLDKIVIQKLLDGDSSDELSDDCSHAVIKVRSK